MNNKNLIPEIEEGELCLDVSLDALYTPLERPVRKDEARSCELVQSDVDDETDSSTSTDTSCEALKEPKIKKRKPIKHITPKPNEDKLKIWSNVLEDESVSSNLTNIHLDESQMKIMGLVPYVGKHDCNESDKRNGNNAGKRNYAGLLMNGKKNVQGNKPKSKKGLSRRIRPIPDSAKNSNKELARVMAKRLNEVKRDIMLRAVQVAGKEKAIAIFEETRKIEKAGGLLVMNGSRRRTPGGVFFYLLKTDSEMKQEQLQKIFHFERDKDNPIGGTQTNVADTNEQGPQSNKLYYCNKFHNPNKHNRANNPGNAKNPNTNNLNKPINPNIPNITKNRNKPKKHNKPNNPNNPNNSNNANSQSNSNNPQQRNSSNNSNNPQQRNRSNNSNNPRQRNSSNNSNNSHQRNSSNNSNNPNRPNEPVGNEYRNPTNMP